MSTIQVTVDGINNETALQRACDDYNTRRNTATLGGATPLTVEQFVQTLMDQHLAQFNTDFLKPVMAPYDFLQRFTTDERIAIREAAKSNGALADYMELLTTARNVYVTDPITIAGVRNLEAAGLLAAGRGDQILAL